MRSVFVGLVLLAVIPLNDAACWVKNLKQGATHCQDAVDKTWHAVGSSWTNSRCHKCQCKNDILGCCDGLTTSVYHPEDCIVKFDYKTCTYEVYKESDPTILCPKGTIGK